MALKKDNLKNVTDYLKDPILSLSAKGLLASLIDLEDGFDISVDKLYYDLCGNGFDSIKSAVKELEENGYLLREQRREAGKYQVDYWIYDKSVIPNRVDKKPCRQMQIKIKEEWGL